MKYYFAPLEGITGFVFRRLHHKYFGGPDKYYMPFVSAMEKGKIKKREKRDILPENNENIPSVPQILTNSSLDFLDTAEMITELGYPEISINLGCPALSVVKRGKGSGFLSDPDKLDRFLDEVFNGMEKRGITLISENWEGEELKSPDKPSVRLSVKTRIGRRDSEVVPKLIEIYNRYPMSELTVHPRVGKDFYRGTPDLEAFRAFYEESRHPLVYNGDIYSEDDLHKIEEMFPKVQNIMIGRGLLQDPALIRRFNGFEGADKDELKAFTAELYQQYRVEMETPGAGGINAVNRMKELWGFLSVNFSEKERCIRKILRAKNPVEYESAVREIWQ